MAWDTKIMQLTNENAKILMCIYLWAEFHMIDN